MNKEELIRVTASAVQDAIEKAVSEEKDEPQEIYGVICDVLRKYI